MPWLLNAVEQLRAAGRWQAIARERLRDDITRLHARLTQHVLTEADESLGEPRLLVDRWVKAGGERADFALGRLEEMHAAQSNDFAALSVAVGELRELS
jgi:NAD-specific glutamate dehydrogenase